MSECDLSHPTGLKGRNVGAVREPPTGRAYVRAPPYFRRVSRPKCLGRRRMQKDKNIPEEETSS